MYDYDEKGLHMNNQWTNSIRVIMPTTSPKDVTLVIRKVTTFIEEWTNSEYGLVKPYNSAFASKHEGAGS